MTREAKIKFENGCVYKSNQGKKFKIVGRNEEGYIIYIPMKGCIASKADKKASDVRVNLATGTEQIRVHSGGQYCKLWLRASDKV